MSVQQAIAQMKMRQAGDMVRKLERIQQMIAIGAIARPHPPKVRPQADALAVTPFGKSLY